MLPNNAVKVAHHKALEKLKNVYHYRGITRVRTTGGIKSLSPDRGNKMKRQGIDKIKKLSLNKFEEALKDMIIKGELDSAIDENLIMNLEEEIEPVTLSDEELARLYDIAKRASMEKALMGARKKISSVNQPFGHYLTRRSVYDWREKHVYNQKIFCKLCRL